MDLNQIQNEVFHRFLEFGLNVFLEIAHNYSMRQFLTSGPGKTHEKKTGDPNLGQTGKTFFTIFLSLVYYFSYKLHRMIVWNNF